jgi:hypothetical protein
MPKSFMVPQTVRNAAKKGLVLRKKFHRGGLSTKQAGKLHIGSGITRAVTLVRGRVSERTVRRMKAYFSRHKGDKRRGWDNPQKPTNGYIAWLLWGGDAGKKWSEQKVKVLDKKALGKKKLVKKNKAKHKRSTKKR